MTVTRAIKTGERKNVYDTISVPGHPDELVLPVLQMTSRAGGKDWIRDFKKGSAIEIWNMRNGRRMRTFKDEFAFDTTNWLYSPDARRYYRISIADDPNGPPKEGGNSTGYFVVHDNKAGKILWEVSGGPKHFVAPPLFFITPTKIVMRDTIYDANHKKSMPLYLSTGKARFRARAIGAVTDRMGRAFSMTSQGLALWDVSRNRLLHRWRDIKEADPVALSPSQRILAIQAKRSFEFWKFDPRWLR